MASEISPLGKMAATYASRYGWSILPCHSIVQGPAGPQCSCNQPDCTSPGKHPRSTKGVNDATGEIKQIWAWWNEWPEANIGVATGAKSNIVVLDLDAKAGGPDAWSEMLDQHGTAETLTTITGGGGAHWIFQAPPQALRSTTSVISKGIDTRAYGGYIILPPSNHVSGQTYEWDNKTDPQPMPDWLFDLWPKHQASTQSLNGNGHHADPKDFAHWVVDALANGAPEGERNATAHRLASYFRAKGIPRDIILMLMQDFGAKCTPPMEVPELQRTIDSAQRYAVQLAEANVSDPPEFEEHLGSLTYTWYDPGVRIRLEGLHRDGRGTQCEITIDSVGGEREKAIIGPVGYNLTSISGRETLIRTVSKRWEIDWGEVLEKLTRMATAYLRVGEPVRYLRDYMYRPSSTWILNPLILDEQPTILFGPGGLGKSLMALAALLTVETGAPILPNLKHEPGHRGIYLDWERTGTHEHGTRFRRLLNGAGLEPNQFETLYLPCTGSISQNVNHLKKTIDENGVTFAIIDSAGFACGGEPEKAEFALQFFNAVHLLQVPALIIAHQSKGDTRGIPFGSVFWHNAARATWEIRNQQVAGENVLQVGLFNRKSNVGAIGRPIGYQLCFGNDTTEITPFDPRTNTEMAEGVITVADQIAALVEQAPMTVKQLAETTGKKDDIIRKTLNANKRRFSPVENHTGEKLWGLQYQA